MKKIAFLTFILTILISCDNIKSSENNKIKSLIGIKSNSQKIVGSWIIKSALVYSNGEEKNVVKNDEHNLLVGSFKNPKYYMFTRYNEAFVFFRNDKSNQEVSTYEIEEDHIIFSNFSTAEIITLTSDELVIKQEVKFNYLDTSVEYPKTIITLFLKKI